MAVREKQPSEKRLIDREALLSFEKMDADGDTEKHRMPMTFAAMESGKKVLTDGR